VSTLLNIAKCHVHAGKLTLAADDYTRALTLNEDTVGQTRKKELAEYASEALAALQSRIPRLRIAVKAPPPDLRVTRDGQAVPAAALGLAVPVDPGEHVIVASAPGHKTETVRVTIAEKASSEVAIDLVPDVAEPGLAVQPFPQPSPPPLLPPRAAPEAPPSPAKGGVPAWAWVTGVAGLALGGVAIYFAVDGAGANCGGPCTDATFTQAQIDVLNTRRHRDLGLGLALGGAGAAGIALGAVGIATAPSGGGSGLAGVVVHPWIAHDQAGIGLRGGF
jgi:hypothetical protein